MLISSLVSTIILSESFNLWVDQRNRDVIGDTALLSAFISLQTCVTDLKQLEYDLDHQRQYFEALQEKLTALRDAR